jgi:hypothetical protein
MPVHNAKVAKAIAEAAPLLRQVKEAQARIDELKILIRAEAEKVSTKRGDDALIEFESSEGTATVCFVKDAIGVVKGANLRLLKETLPAWTWNHLFEEKVVLSDEFGEAFEQLDKAAQKSVKKMVEWKPREPRVTLPK